MADMQPTATDVSQAFTDVSRHSARTLFARVGRTILLTSLVVISLLTFPSSVPWMIAFWLVWHTIAIAYGKPAWMPLLACIAILLANAFTGRQLLLDSLALLCSSQPGTLRGPARWLRVPVSAGLRPSGCGASGHLWYYSGGRLPHAVT